MPRPLMLLAAPGVFSSSGSLSLSKERAGGEVLRAGGEVLTPPPELRHGGRTRVIMSNALCSPFPACLRPASSSTNTGAGANPDFTCDGLSCDGFSCDGCPGSRAGRCAGERHAAACRPCVDRADDYSAGSRRADCAAGSQFVRHGAARRANDCRADERRADKRRADERRAGGGTGAAPAGESKRR